MARAVNDAGAPTCINNGLPGEVMRKAMENKNILQAKGAMYVGTGTTQTITIADANSDGIEGNYVVAVTEALNPPTEDGTYILQCVVTGGSATLSWVPKT